MPEAQPNDTFSAWYPGIEPEIPFAYRELETIYDQANVLTSIDSINQLVSETGLSALELIRFRPQRLALHELIVRITADIVVSEGKVEEDLGINFRAMAKSILERYVMPQMAQIEQTHSKLRTQIESLTKTTLETAIAGQARVTVSKPGFWQRLIGLKPKPETPKKTREELEFELIDGFKTRGLEATDEVEAAVFRSLYRVLGSIVRTRGFLGYDTRYFADICAQHAHNYLSGRFIGRLVGEYVNDAIRAEGYRLIPDAEHPILISLKGASASGKSSLRPKMRSMLAKLGVDTHGYGTISPDIWRKLLLDYASLGESYKYAGRFASHEISVIDAKLDRYIRAKAEQRQSIPHLVVDRFRFDSFASEKIGRVLHKTYVRYIDTMYMYFIVTPPEATVERGWQRGHERGRYKAVEDYLGHCVEAYAGMPKLLFKWLANDRPHFIFEFLDNSVPRGTYPTLIARGSQGTMQIFDPRPLIDIERFQRINIQATAPQQVAANSSDLTVEKNLGFLRQCVNRIELVEFIDSARSGCYLAARSGKFEVIDKPLFEVKLEDATLRQIIVQLAPELLEN